MPLYIVIYTENSESKLMFVNFQPKNRRELIEKLAKGTVKTYFSENDHTVSKIQCSTGRSRSLSDLIIVSNIYFPGTTLFDIFEDLEAIFDSANDDSLSYYRYIFCTSVKDYVIVSSVINKAEVSTQNEKALNTFKSTAEHLGYSKRYSEFETANFKKPIKVSYYSSKLAYLKGENLKEDLAHTAKQNYAVKSPISDRFLLQYSLGLLGNKDNIDRTRRYITTFLKYYESMPDYAPIIEKVQGFKKLFK